MRITSTCVGLGAAALLASAITLPPAQDVPPREVASFLTFLTTPSMTPGWTLPQTIIASVASRAGLVITDVMVDATGGGTGNQVPPFQLLANGMPVWQAWSIGNVPYRVAFESGVKVAANARLEFQAFGAPTSFQLAVFVSGYYP